MINKLYNFLTVDIQNRNPFEYRKEIVLRIFLMFASAILLPLSLINYFIYEEFITAIVYFQIFILSVFILKKLKDSFTLEKAIQMTTGMLILFFIGFFYLNEANYHFWLIFLPLIIVPINGYKKGLLILSVVYSILFFFAYFGIDEWQNKEWREEDFIDFIFLTLALNYMVFITELSILRQNRLFYKKIVTKRKKNEFRKKK